MSPRLTINDLDVEKQKDPFTIVLANEDGTETEYTFPDPKAQSFDFLMGFGTRTPSEMIEAILGTEAFDAFRKHPEVTGYVMSEIMAQYAKHFGIQLPKQAP
jgi:hypothetical protein